MEAHTKFEEEEVVNYAHAYDDIWQQPYDLLCLKWASDTTAVLSIANVAVKSRLVHRRVRAPHYDWLHWLMGLYTD